MGAAPASEAAVGDKATSISNLHVGLLGQEPLRTAVVGVDALEPLARQLATIPAKLEVRAARPSLLQRFRSNHHALSAAYERILAGIRAGEPLTSVAEWYLDNFYIIKDVCREVRHDLPRSYYRELQKLAAGPLAGYPRVYALAVGMIAHTDSGLSEPHLIRFVQAFQTTAPLTIGELWAVPIMFRLALLENLRRLAERLLRSWDERHAAQRWIEPHKVRTEVSGQSPPPLGALPESSDLFLVTLLDELRAAGPGGASALEQLKAQLTSRGLDPLDLARRENQREAGDQVSVGNAVTSLRLLAALDWKTFFEQTSLVEPILQRDPAGIYELQDFATRNRLREAVERLARRSGHSELDVAQNVVELARRNPARSHIGHYLIGDGRRELERTLDYRPAPRERVLQVVRAYPRLAYFGLMAILLSVAFVGIGAIVGLFAASGVSLGWRLAAGLAPLLPISQLAVDLTNFLFSLFLPPRVLPKLEFKNGIPANCNTFVVMPSMLVRPQSAAVLLEKLEIHYLANPDPQLKFALLTDFADAPTETQPEDQGYLDDALRRVRELNQRHAAEGTPRFYLFHRRRVYNPDQGCWMGWERKRGKLQEFNRLLRGARNTTYTVQSGSLPTGPAIQFVITLDADTQLPRDAARRLVGTLAHPLNRPRFDARAGRVVAGYAILQPRVSFHIPAMNRSPFTRIWARSAGIDPYSTAVSDLYQDLFGAGSFTGKGIYDVDGFEQALGHTFPENHILSHDLIEGNFARCGLVTDIELFDDFPARYHAYARREHRWVRGDWQLLPWLGRYVPVAAELSPEATTPAQPIAGRRRNPLPLLERWKVFDNLRRSLVPPALVLLLAGGWTVFPGSAWCWTALAALIIGLPLLLQIAGATINTVRSLATFSLVELIRSAPATLGQVALSGAFLMDQARLMVDAIVRTLWRLFISRRHLLEWETAASAERRLGSGLGSFVATMWPSLVLTVLLAGLVAWVQPTALPAAALFLFAWVLAPLPAFLVSRPLPERRESPLTAEETRELRAIARRTWAFFETFVNADHHWLPPDNFQEEPRGRLAARTSPTNQGMLLLSTLAAHDLGYISLETLLARLEQTFQTFERMGRFRGHFFNWYDTQSLQPLQPAYISTVDSGNLLGCLLALKQGLKELEGSTPAGPVVRQGLADTLGLVAAELEKCATTTDGPAVEEVRRLTTELAAQLQETSTDLPAWDAWLERGLKHAQALHQQAATLKGAKSRGVTELTDWTRRLVTQLQDHQQSVRSAAPRLSAERDQRLRQLAARADALARAMDFRFLYKSDRHLFAIGFNLSQGRLDNSSYDLLASEACLTSFLAIARGDVPPQHWFHLGRLLTRTAGRTTLISWGGTMFEYLMPPLLLRYYEGTLLGDSSAGAVAHQIEYARQAGVPWGISESAFSSQYVSFDYQYQSFGVPGLGLKRGLGRDLVIAPYATALAAPVQPHAVLQNFRRLAAEGALGRYGFYEAIDYTRDRLPAGRRSLVVRCFMAHHQGMSLVALTNAVLGAPMQRRFHAEPQVRATELLLQERIPAVVQPLPAQEEDLPAPANPAAGAELLSRRLTTPNTMRPRAHLISSGTYTVVLTNSGSGFSSCRGLDVTRWREDPTRDCWGQFFYICDPRSQELWSAGYQPLGRLPEDYEVTFSTDKGEIRRVDGRIETRLSVTVSPEKSVEIRRLTLTNHDTRARELEVTSYAEVALATRGADLAHPAFHKLFLETEWLDQHQLLLCRRRPRSPEQPPVWALHLLAVEGQTAGPVEYETDRARFLGRGRTSRNPASLEPGVSLSGTTGKVLDPVFSLRQRVRVPAGGAVHLNFATGVAYSHEEALQLADEFRDSQSVMRAFDLAWAQTQIELSHLHLNSAEAHLFQRLGSHLLYHSPDLRARADVLAVNRQGQPALWKYGISGDQPIVLLRIADAEALPLARQLLTGHAYLRINGLDFDLVLLVEEPTTYTDELYQHLAALLRSSEDHQLTDKAGGIFLRKADHLAADDRVLLQTAARVLVSGNQGPLAAQLDRQAPPPVLPAGLPSRPRPTIKRPLAPPRLSADLLFANGLGGFTPDGREYCILPYAAAPEQGLRLPPAPWVNVIANPAFGCLVSESSLGCTWAINSQQFRLTPWNNDPVSDTSGEALYLRDEDSGICWTPTPLPLGADSPTLVRHGQGYTVFEQQSHGLSQELSVFIAPQEPVKILVLKLRNQKDEACRLSATFYAEWTLGGERERCAPYIITEHDAELGALLARNPYQPDYADQLGFVAVGPTPHEVTADRAEFLGRNGTLAAPAALGRVGLSGRAGAGHDPCAAIQVKVKLQPGEQTELVFLLGAVAGREAVRQLIQRFNEPAAARAALTAVREQWDRLLTAVQVRTPEPAFDLLLNRWLLYQVLSCRVWGRAGFYQASGAYGFRDQLQDVLALVHALPGEARAHILRAASRQFVEGDVQHWWHPPGGVGVRTRCSDDFLWLPFAVCHYVQATGDHAILDEEIAFLQAPLLGPTQAEAYGMPETADESGTLYEHCVRAVQLGLRVGQHGLPLMGAGDWNDGMNRVGVAGHGESVWLAWFLLDLLPKFAELANSRDHAAIVAVCRESVAALREAVEAHAWDGQWYRRAYFDDGTPLGSAQNTECRIDSLAQTWAIISGAGDAQRSAQALEMVYRELVQADDGLIRLLTPPFDEGPLQPGYIKGYLPGIRENGGQYTHAAAWVVQAAARAGQGTRAVELYRMLNPIHHSDSPAGSECYRIEPYVLAGDIYSTAPHAGRGGWSWYTGSASWFYRVGLETLLGFQRRGSHLRLDPCIARTWPDFEVAYRYGSATYRIRVENPRGAEGGVQECTLDGEPCSASDIPLQDDGRQHALRLVLGN